MKYRTIITTLMLTAGIFNSYLPAQNDTIYWENAQYIEKNNTWLECENASQLHTFDNENRNISDAKLYFGKTNGEFINYHESNNSLKAGLGIQSYYRFNKRIVFFGKIGYEFFNGKNMSGSYFIDPYRTPFDLIELTEENRGTKRSENYFVSGAVSGDILKNLHIGGRIDYTGANYTKQKDLRHINSLMDMAITIGMSYRPVKWVEIGANYFYNRRVESLAIGIYGTTDKIYKSLVSYGAFAGKIETAGENGYTNTTDEKPLCDTYHGVGAQLAIYGGKHIKIYDEFSYRTRTGYYGNRSPYKVIYSTHNSISYLNKGAIKITENKNIHTIGVTYEEERLTNNENIYRHNSDGSGRVFVDYLGKLETTQRKDMKVGAEYTGNYNIKNNYPVWIFNAGFHYTDRMIKASMYPSYRKQIIDTYRFRLAGTYNIMYKKNMFSIKLSETYGLGKGIQKDGSYMPGTTTSALSTMDSFMHKEYEYMTANQLHNNIIFRYTRGLVKPRIKIYAEAEYLLSKAFNVQYIKDMTHNFKINIGCIF